MSRSSEIMRRAALTAVLAVGVASCAPSPAQRKTEPPQSTMVGSGAASENHATVEQSYGDTTTTDAVTGPNPRRLPLNTGSELSPEASDGIRHNRQNSDPPTVNEPIPPSPLRGMHK